MHSTSLPVQKQSEIFIHRDVADELSGHVVVVVHTVIACPIKCISLPYLPLVSSCTFFSFKVACTRKYCGGLDKSKISQGKNGTKSERLQPFTDGNPNKMLSAFSRKQVIDRNGLYAQLKPERLFKGVLAIYCIHWSKPLVPPTVSPFCSSIISFWLPYSQSAMMVS